MSLMIQITTVKNQRWESGSQPRGCGFEPRQSHRRVLEQDKITSSQWTQPKHQQRRRHYSHDSHLDKVIGTCLVHPIRDYSDVI